MMTPLRLITCMSLMALLGSAEQTVLYKMPSIADVEILETGPGQSYDPQTIELPLSQYISSHSSVLEVVLLDDLDDVMVLCTEYGALKVEFYEIDDLYAVIQHVYLCYGRKVTARGRAAKSIDRLIIEVAENKNHAQQDAEVRDPL